MLVSVIITTFHRPSLLLRAARSVVQQSLPENVKLELIISDDDQNGSGISALARIQQEAPNSIRLYYVNRGMEAGGVARARNRALDICHGDWIAFLDDDDFLLPNAIVTLLGLAIGEEADFCAGAFELVQEDSSCTAISRTLVTQYWSYESLLVGNLFAVGSYLIKRASVTVPFNSQLRTHEDWLFLLDNLVSSVKVSISSSPVLEVRQVTDASRDHRNTFGGNKQRAADFARVYALYPSSELATRRKAILQDLGGTNFGDLIGETINSAPPNFVDTKQGRFLICNQAETIQQSLLVNRKFEPLAAAIASVIAAIKPGTIVDIGANIGTFSVPVALSLPKSIVISVEPQPMVFMHLCANLLGNRITTARALNVAVGIESPGKTLQVPWFDIFAEKYTGSVSLDPAVQAKRGVIDGVAEPSQWATEFESIKVVPLDTIVNSHTVSFVKVDVEGMEETVLRSGESLLRTQRPALFFEAWSLPNFHDERLSLIGYVLSLGYSVLQIGEDCFAYHADVLDTKLVLSGLAGLGLFLKT